MMTLFDALSAGVKSYLQCNFPVFLFSAFTERQAGCFYKFGCVVKFSILMSTMFKNYFFQSYIRGLRRLPFLHHCLQYVWSASSTLLWHLVKSIVDGSLHLCTFLKSCRYPLSGIQVRSPVITWPAGGYRNSESTQGHEDWKELRISGSEVAWL